MQIPKYKSLKQNMLLIAAILIACPMMAQVRTDGSVGPVVDLSGNMVIGSSLGKQVGANLFQSFSLFNVKPGESALFTSSVPSTANIIGRVTGGSLSMIDGPLGCDVPNANLWLINPNGIVFGEGASLDVQGSFYASTANYLKFEDGSSLSADLESSSDALFSTASPSAFGFLGSAPSPISVNGSQLTVPAGKDLALVGGELDIAGNGGYLAAAGGRIDLVSVAGSGEVGFNNAGAMNVASFARLGTILFREDAYLTASSDLSAGSVYIRGGQFFMSDSTIWNSTGILDGGPIDISMTENIELTENSLILSETQGFGSGGAIQISAPEILLQNSEIDSVSANFGNGGDVIIEGSHVTFESSSIYSTARSYGTGGSISISAESDVKLENTGDSADSQSFFSTDTVDAFGDAGSVYVSSPALILNDSSIDSFTYFGWGNAGSIEVNVNDLILENGGNIQSVTKQDSTGMGGIISINAGNSIVISGTSPTDPDQASGLFADTYTGSMGGSIALNAGSIRLNDEGYISASSLGSGDGIGGYISIDTGTLSLSNASFIGVVSTGEGEGGMINIIADYISVDSGSGFSSTTVGVGRGGDISLTANRIDVTDRDSMIFAGTMGPGDSGFIIFDASILSLSNGGSIRADTLGSGNGGSIVGTADSILVDNGGVYWTGFFSETRGSGNSGYISLEANDINLTETGYISTSSWSSGDAGSVFITANSLSLSNGAAIAATSMSNGAGGLISVSADSISIDGSDTGVFSETHGSGQSGSIWLTADNIDITNQGSISASTSGTGDAGLIYVDAGTLTLTEQGLIRVDSYGDGSGGTISVEADAILVDGGGTNFSTGFFSSVKGSGKGGSIFLTADRIDLINRGIIDASTDSTGDAGWISVAAGTLSLVNEASMQVVSFAEGDAGLILAEADLISIDGSQATYGTGISSSARMSGNGGDIRLDADKIEINTGVISANSVGTGKAGSLLVNAADTLRLTDSFIRTGSQLSAGGNIHINVGGQLYLQNSTLTSSANGVTPEDDGGNMDINAPQFLILNNSDILARANAGNGGNIDLAADYFLQSTDSIINASSEKGLDGQIVIDSPNKVTGTVADLEVPSLDVSELLRERCTAAALRARSSFTVEGRSGLASRPGDFLASPFNCDKPEENIKQKKTDQ
ncbi:MAG: filamentous hemagglutinin N-terminal domain-containing protein [Acidobacteria bacterium]|nr:filamentous hemagglutinin N-terminal domain-containing protein [Acidobacteriota bacterium]